MDQVKDLADDRLVNGCLYCGGLQETREHVPSRVFLDLPFPEQLPVVWACSRCNNDFSKDEAYVACLIECAIAGSTDPTHIRRSRVSRLLQETPALRARLEAAKTVTDDGLVQFDIEPNRTRNVVLKLARGHAVFELSQVRRDEPKLLWWYPLPLMTEAQRDDFDASHVVQMIGEVGSRGSQRLLATQITLESLKDGA